MLPDIALSDVKYKHGQKLPQERQKIATVIRTWGGGFVEFRVTHEVMRGGRVYLIDRQITVLLATLCLW